MNIRRAQSLLFAHQDVVLVQDLASHTLNALFAKVVRKTFQTYLSSSWYFDAFILQYKQGSKRALSVNIWVNLYQKSKASISPSVCMCAQIFFCKYYHRNTHTNHNTITHFKCVIVAVFAKPSVELCERYACVLSVRAHFLVQSTDATSATPRESSIVVFMSCPAFMLVWDRIRSVRLLY